MEALPKNQISADAQNATAATQHDVGLIVRGLDTNRLGSVAVMDLYANIKESGLSLASQQLLLSDLEAARAG